MSGKKNNMQIENKKDESAENPLEGMTEDELCAQAVREYTMAIDLYDDVADHIASVVELRGDTHMTEATVQVFDIVADSVTQLISKGREALLTARDRLAKLLEIEVPTSSYRCMKPLVVPPACRRTPDDFRMVAADLENLAQILYSSVLNFSDLTSAMKDSILLGDTHPYGDTIYGIALPYLLMTSDGLISDADAWEQPAGAR